MNSVGTWPMGGSGSSRVGSGGRNSGGTSQCPEFSAQSGRWTVDDIRM